MSDVFGNGSTLKPLLTNIDKEFGTQKERTLKEEKIWR
jgi:hypothetical protein